MVTTQPYADMSKRDAIVKKKDTYRLFSWTAFTRCRHILKTVKNVTVANFELAFTRCRHNLKTVGNLMVKNSLQDFVMPKKCTYTLRID